MSKHYFFIITSILLIIMLLVVGIIFQSQTLSDESEDSKLNMTTKNMSKEESNTDCYKYKNVIVNGNSMKGIVSDKEEIKYISNWYECNQNEVLRNDIVILKNPSNSDSLLVKRIVAIPNDTIRLNNEKNNVKINGNLLTLYNSSRQFELKNTNLIEYYIKSYNNTIPNNSFMILGNINTGTKDSTKFGFIPKSSIEGKVIIN